MLGGDLAERKRASCPGIGEDDVEAPALGFHCRVEPIQIGLIRDRALHRAGTGSKLANGRIECLLPTAVNEDEGTFFDETSCSREAYAGGAARDHGGLSI